jgi:hypothetical protein
VVYISVTIWYKLIMSNLPGEVIVNPKEKLLYVTPELEASFPDVADAFWDVNETYRKNPGAVLKNLSDSQYTLNSSTGAQIDYSIIPGRGSELLVMWAPFSDRSPKSDSETLLQYMYLDDADISRNEAAPNTWNQMTKSGVISELLKAAGCEMPVLTIFSPLPSVPKNAYTHQENKKIRNGDFGPAARITEEAIRAAQERLHSLGGETQLELTHLQGASLGASSALGAANESVHTVTAQELIIAPRNLLDLGARFTIKDPVGEKSQLVPEKSWSVISEPLLRKKIESKGNEPMMIGRMLQGMSKFTRLMGLTHPESSEMPHIIERLAAAGVSVMIPLAETSGLTHDTPKYLPDNGEHVVKVRATEGERTAHLIDEHVALTALMTVLNIRNSRA